MKPRAVFLASFLALLLSAPAIAQGGPVFEVSPFYGYRLGGSLKDYNTGTRYSLDDDVSYGATLGYNINDETTIELLFSRQESGVDLSSPAAVPRVPLTVDQWMIGGCFQYDTGTGKLRPFLGGGMGFTRFATSVGGGSSSARFGVTLGGGLKYLFSRHVGVRLDVRGFFTFVGTTDAICSLSYGCLATFSGGGLLQGEGTGGLVFAF